MSAEKPQSMLREASHQIIAGGSAEGSKTWEEYADDAVLIRPAVVHGAGCSRLLKCVSSMTTCTHERDLHHGSM
ncbi:hypothetical protein EYF80_049123 [Liparis tanakae]|uniref:Uncharacterized protein n=1 Tax=Liparis tanakae TaxID=230148 RepID=A0A4Z2FHK9_9TELE|nr:hypothetical protein EYF80_049123 [Liparis tanakae]